MPAENLIPPDPPPPRAPIQSEIKQAEPASAAVADREALLIAMEMRGCHAPELQAERLKLIQAEHDLGHFGREGIYKKLVAKSLWWPLMRKDIEEELRSCDDCLKTTIVKRGSHPAQFVHSMIPWDHVQIDTATNLPESIDGKTVLLVVIDVCSGFVVLQALPDKEWAHRQRAVVHLLSSRSSSHRAIG